MNKKNPVITILKGVSLLVLDFITLFVVFLIWSILDVALFPWAFLIILGSLILLNAVVLLSDSIIRSIGVPIYASITAATILLYGIVIVFTGLIYDVISTNRYILTISFVLLAYIIIITGLYVSGVRNKEDVVRRELEQNKVADINLQFMNLFRLMKEVNGVIDKNDYDKMMKHYESAKERIQSSTPFGRISKPNIIDMETKISTKLYELCNEVASLKSAMNKQDQYDNIIKNLSELKIWIINREQMMI